MSQDTLAIKRILKRYACNLEKLCLNRRAYVENVKKYQKAHRHSKITDFEVKRGFRVEKQKLWQEDRKIKKRLAPWDKKRTQKASRSEYSLIRGLRRDRENIEEQVNHIDRLKASKSTKSKSMAKEAESLKNGAIRDIVQRGNQLDFRVSAALSLRTVYRDGQ